MRSRALALALLLACSPAAEPQTQTPTQTPTPTPTQTQTPTQTPTAAPLAEITPPFAPSEILERGSASWYGSALAGHHTANGEIFDPSKLTAAHRTLKLGTWLDVRRTDTGRTVRVRVNDRGPVSHRFIIDLSSEAARELGMLRMGVAPVETRIVR